MPVIAPAQSSLRVMPVAATPHPGLSAPLPDPAAGMQMFEQAAKLPLLMEQIKMEKVRQKAEKAKLDLAEMDANYKMQNFQKLAQQQQVLADAQVSLAQSQAAAAAKPAAVQANEEANALIAQDLMARASRLGINANNYIMADTGQLDVEGLNADMQAKAAEMSGAIAPAEAPLATAVVGAPAAATPATTPPELVSVSQRLTTLSPRAVAIQRYTADNPSMPFNLLNPAEQGKALQPYLSSAAPKTRKVDYIKDGDKFEATVTESADGTVTYRVDEPVHVSSAPESRATATVKTKLAFMDETMTKIDRLDKKLDEYEKSGAFGVWDTQMAKWASSPETAVPLRAIASWFGADETKALFSEIAGIGAKTMTELAGSAQTKGEAERLGPYVPASSDVVMGPKELRRKLQEFKTQLGISRNSLETQFGLKAKQPAETPSGATPSASSKAANPALKTLSDRTNNAISNYIQRKRA